MCTPPKSPTPLLSLEDCGTKGLGLVATSELVPGLLLISEPAILRVTLMGDQLSPGAVKDVSRQFSSLDSEERATVMSLVNYDDVSCDILGIFKTNAMNISPSEAALFPWVCRANHSCDPNCNYYHNADTGRQELYCTRVIRAGEEVTVSYLPDTVIGTRESRRRHLMESHRFLCECAVCSMSGAALEEEERQRAQCVRRIGELNKMAETLPLSIGDCPLKRKYKLGCLDLLNQLEGLAVPLSTIYNVKVCMFSIYIMLGDSLNGVIWAQELIRISNIMSGKMSEVTQGWQDTYDVVTQYTEDITALEDTVKDWSMII